MKWQNVQGHEFLEAMRTQCIEWGTKNMTEKQKEGIKKCVGHPDTRKRRALYPPYLALDPTMKDLLLLTQEDLKQGANVDKKLSELLLDLKSRLEECGLLSYKQLKYAGSAIHQLKLKK